MTIPSLASPPSLKGTKLDLIFGGTKFNSTLRHPTDCCKIQLVLTYMQKGYSGKWTVPYSDKMRALSVAQHYQWDSFKEVLLKGFASLNKGQEAQAEMAQVKQGKMLTEEYLTCWGQFLVKAKYVIVKANYNDVDYLIHLLHNNDYKSTVYTVEQEDGMFTSGEGVGPQKSSQQICQHCGWTMWPIPALLSISTSHFTHP